MCRWRTLGAIFFNYRQHHVFTNEEHTLFPMLAEIAATSVRDAARMEATDKAQIRLQAALRVSESVGTSLDQDQTLRNILQTLCELFPNTTPFVLLYADLERALEFPSASLAFYQIDNPEYRGLTSLPLEGASISCKLARQSLISKQVSYKNVPDVAQDGDYIHLRLDTRSELCLTLMSEERLLGVIALESPQLNHFQEHDEALTRSVGQQVSIVLDRIERNAQLRFKTTVAATTAWAAEIAHDINREVGYIRNRVYWLQDASAADDSAAYLQENRCQRRTIERHAERSAPLERARSEQLSIDYVAAPANAEHAQRTQRTDADDIRHHCAGICVYAHTIALKSVLRHLVRNALAAMPANGSLTLRTQFVRGQHAVEVQLEDSGSGISSHLRQVIFQEPVNAGRGAGGFGLLYVRFTVEEMGGTVRLLPTMPGRGATFAFTLPVAPRALY